MTGDYSANDLFRHGPGDATVTQIGHAIAHACQAGARIGIWLDAMPEEDRWPQSADRELGLAIDALAWAREALARERRDVQAARRYTTEQ